MLTQALTKIFWSCPTNFERNKKLLFGHKFCFWTEVMILEFRHLAGSPKLWRCLKIRIFLQNLFFPIVGRSGDRYLKQNKVKTWPELQLDGLSWILNKEVSILHFVFFWREISWEISGKTYVLTKFFWFIKNNGRWLSKIICLHFWREKS